MVMERFLFCVLFVVALVTVLMSPPRGTSSVRGAFNAGMPALSGEACPTVEAYVPGIPAV